MDDCKINIDIIFTGIIFHQKQFYIFEAKEVSPNTFDDSPKNALVQPP